MVGTYLQTTYFYDTQVNNTYKYVYYGHNFIGF